MMNWDEGQMENKLATAESWVCTKCLSSNHFLADLVFGSMAGLKQTNNCQACPECAWKDGMAAAAGSVKSDSLTRGQHVYNKSR